ncbi:uncharacterized protein DDB_G0286105-like [Drosophila montana]|uniref:uncharacterized protein DDB_G0286105-like n=1 Tax=Drosophila montana TaxID=40370 RepID=UPI00313E06A5
MPATALAAASGHTTKLSNNHNHNNNNNSNNNSNNISNSNNNIMLNNNMNNSLCNSIAHLSDSRTNLTVNTPTACQRLSEMFRRSIASSTQSSSRENTYEEKLSALINIRAISSYYVIISQAAELR